MKLFIFSLLFTMSYGIPFFDTELEWKFIEYDWDSSQQKQEAIDSGNYKIRASVLYDVDKAKDGRTFVTSVREEGVPASLMTVTDKCGPGGPLLRPYPDWSWYRLDKNCSDFYITSVYRVDIKCNYLFVLDCGMLGNDRLCPAQLLIFDLSNDQLVKRVEIPDDVAGNPNNNTSILVTPIVDVNGSCENILDNCVVFMADVHDFALITWQAQNNQLCKFTSDYMMPTDTDFTINGDSFSLDDGILGMTLINKALYYAALSGDTIYKIKESSLTCGLSFNETTELSQLVATLSGQTGPMASKKCALFFSNIPETSILCLDSGKPINSSDMIVIEKNSELMQFPSGMKTRGCALLILTNRYQLNMNGTHNLNETNYRILRANLSDIRHNTNCFDSCYNDYHHHHHHHHHHPLPPPPHYSRHPPPPRRLPSPSYHYHHDDDDCDDYHNHYYQNQRCW